jgi:hypothetical protein
LLKSYLQLMHHLRDFCMLDISIIILMPISIYFSVVVPLTLWSLVHSWIDFSSIESQNPSDHFIQFIYSTRGHCAWRSFLQLIWLVCVWIVCNEKNHHLFRNSAKSLHQMLDKVKIYLVWWLKAKNINLVVNLHSR